MYSITENVVGKWFLLSSTCAKDFVAHNIVNDFAVRSMFDKGFLDPSTNVYVLRVTKQTGKCVTEIESTSGSKLEVLISLEELNRFFFRTTVPPVDTGASKMVTFETIDGKKLTGAIVAPEKFVKQEEKKWEPNLDDFVTALKEYFRMGIGVISSDTQRFGIGNFEAFERHIKDTVKTKREEIKKQIEELQKKLG